MPNLIGTMTLEMVDSRTGEVLHRIRERNVIVDDAKETILAAISAPDADSLVDTVKLGDDFGDEMATATIDFADANPDTITRLSGSFVTDGFVNGDEITIENSSNNDGEYLVDTVTATVLTLDAAESVTADTGEVGLTITRGTTTNPIAPTSAMVAADQDVLLGSDKTLTVGSLTSSQVTFNATIIGQDVIDNYGPATSKDFCSAVLYSGDGRAFAFRRFSKISLSALVDINVTWQIDAV